MKKLILIVYFLFFSIFSYANEKLRVGLFNIVPYAYIEEGKLTGISYDIIQSLEQELNIKLEVKLLPYKRMLHHLELGKIDFAIFFLSDYSEGFSEKLLAMYDLETIVLGKKGLKISSYEDLLGLHMATPRGVRYIAFRSKNKQLNITPVQDYKNAILMLQYHNIDAIIGPKEIIIYQLKLLGLNINDFAQPYVLTKNTAWIQFSNKSKKMQYKDSLKKAGKKLLETNRIDEIINKYYQ